MCALVSYYQAYINKYTYTTNVLGMNRIVLIASRFVCVNYVQLGLPRLNFKIALKLRELSLINVVESAILITLSL